MKALFNHRLPNPDFLTHPADNLSMYDNVGEILDHACAMARTLYAGAAMVDSELDPQDIKNAAWALSHQIQDARALLEAWHAAQANHGGPRS